MEYIGRGGKPLSCNFKRKGKKYKCVIIVITIAAAAVFSIYFSVVTAIPATGAVAAVIVAVAITAREGAAAAVTVAATTGRIVTSAMLRSRSAFLTTYRDTAITATVAVAMTHTMQRSTDSGTTVAVARP